MDLTLYSAGIRVRNLVQGVIWWDNILQALCFFWSVCCNFFCGRLLNFPEDYPNFQSLKVWIVIKHLIWWGLLDVLLVYWQLGEILPSSSQLSLHGFKKAGIYLELAELPARPRKIAPNLCFLARLKPNSKRTLAFLRKLEWWQFISNKWAVGNFNNTFYCLQLHWVPYCHKWH